MYKPKNTLAKNKPIASNWTDKGVQAWQGSNMVETICFILKYPLHTHARNEHNKYKGFRCRYQRRIYKDKYEAR